MSYKFWDLPQFKNSNIYPFHDLDQVIIKLFKTGSHRNWTSPFICLAFPCARGRKQVIVLWQDGTVLTENFL